MPKLDHPFLNSPRAFYLEIGYLRVLALKKIFFQLLVIIGKTICLITNYLRTLFLLFLNLSRNSSVGHMADVQ